MEKGVTALAVSDDLTQVALGCVDGSIILLRSDFSRDRGAAANVRVHNLLEAQPVPPPASGPPSGGARSGDDAGYSAVTFLSFSVHADPNTSGSSGHAGAASRGVGDDVGGLIDAIVGADSTGNATTGAKAKSAARPSLLTAALGSGTKKGAGPAAPHGNMLCLFAVSTSRVRCFFTTDVRPPGLGRGWALADCSITLDEERGADNGCVCLNETGELVVGNDAGVFLYTYEDRRSVYPFMGRKQAVNTLRSHLIVASEDERARATITIYDLKCKFIAFSMTLASTAPAAALTAPTAMTPATGGPRGAVGGRPTATAAPTPSSAAAGGAQRVAFVLKEWGQAFIFVQSGYVPGLDPFTALSTPSSAAAGAGLTVYQLRERDTGSKVEHLCKLQLFDVAAAVASASGYGKEHIADIHKMHGDFSYGNGEYDAAIAQYIKTIGVVEPSYVIRLFLESQRIHNLTVYLEALHSAKRAESEHTTLLLNCYTKLRQPDKLRRFIRGETLDADGTATTGSATGAAAQLSFDVRTAISVLRDAQCYDEALYLAEEHAEHDWYLQIQLEHRSGDELTTVTGTPSAAAPSTGAAAPATSSTTADTSTSHSITDGSETALAYLRRMAFVDADMYIRRYGRVLMTARPDATTDFLIMLCTRYVREKPYLPLSGQRDDTGVVTGTGRERLRAERPEEFLALFVDKPLHLKRFLRALVAKADKHEIPPVSKPLWHALLEVSLRRDVARAEATVTLKAKGAPFSEADVETAVEQIREEDALDGVLRNLSAVTDPDHCLLLCQIHDYRPGTLHLFERLQMYQMVLQHHAEAASTARAAGRYAEARAARRELVRKAKTFTETGPAAAGGDDASAGGSDIVSLWVFVLQYLTSTYSTTLPSGGTVTADDGDALFADVLKYIDAHNLLPPLLVIQLLSAKESIPFGVVRDFVIKRLTVEEERIQEDTRVIDSLRSDTHAMLNEAHRLDTQPVTFQTRKCRSCGSELDLPSIHFMCGGMRGEEHSFHAHCVNDVDPECPLCAPSQRHVREIRSTLAAAAGSREQREQFEHELKHSADGFFKCAEFLSKGVFDLCAQAAASEPAPSRRDRHGGSSGDDE